MEYERVAKIGVLSSCKPRVNLFGLQERRKGEGKSSSSSPIKSEDASYAKCSLLSEDVQLHVEGPNYTPAPDMKSKQKDHFHNTLSLIASIAASPCSKDQESAICQRTLKEGMMFHSQKHKFPKVIESSGNPNLIDPSQTLKDNINGDDGHDNVISSGFEFQKADRIFSTTVALSRPLPSKWADAEKWIVSKLSVHSNRTKKTSGCTQDTDPSSIRGKVNTEAASINNSSFASEVMTNKGPSALQAVDMQKNNSPHIKAGDESDTFSFPNPGSVLNPSLGKQTSNTNLTVSSKFNRAFDSANVGEPPSLTLKSVLMRDMGTEMTPAASQDPSRTGTPIKSPTPIITPDRSVPSTPARDATDALATNLSYSKRVNQASNGHSALSESDLQMKTRKEIKDLGMKLGKLNIAAWASRDQNEQISALVKVSSLQNLQESVFESRAAAWEVAERANYDARYKHEVIKIQTWENRLKTETEAEMRRIKVQMEHMRASTQERLMHRLAGVRLLAEAKQKAAIAKRNQQAAKTAERADYIRRTGHTRRSYFLCCHLD